MKTKITILLLILMIILNACGVPGRGSSYHEAATPTVVPIPALTGTAQPAETSIAATAPALPTSVEENTPALPTATMSPGAWKSMPVVPQVSPRMLEVYRLGQVAGRDPTHFSKIGDCQNITTYFLAAFDDPREYRLGSQYAYLQPTIDHFSGSWSRASLAVHGGMNVAAVQNPFWTLTPKPADCNAGETPMACEIRVNNPSIVTVSMEESWSGDLVHYNMYLRKIVEYMLSQNVVPILATRAETPGSKNSINDIVTQVAYDYQVPLWNFGASVFQLPSYGLTEDGFHLSQAANLFDDPVSMKSGWPWRNLTALEAIDAVYHAVNGKP
jgi:hypothetical protein